MRRGGHSTIIAGAAMSALMACAAMAATTAVPAVTSGTTASATQGAAPAVKPDPVRPPPAPAAAAQPSAKNTPGAAAVGNSAAPASPINPNATPGVLALLQTTDDSARNPVNWSVRVYKSRHLLEVYYKGRFYRSYRAVFGRNLDTSAKAFAGDRRTPEGNYLIISKYPSRRWRWFLKLNYPNMIDLSRYEELRAAHEIPTVAGRPANAGGSIGIHGTDVPMLNEGNINWTTGCISVDNGSVDELEALLPVGTLVVIKR